MPQRGAFGVNGIRSEAASRVHPCRVGESASSTAGRSSSSRENANSAAPFLPRKATGGYAPSSAAAARTRGSFGVDLTNTTGITAADSEAQWLNAVVVKTDKPKARMQQPQAHKSEPPVAAAAADNSRPAQEERRFDPMFGNQVTYVQMCKGLQFQGLSEVQMQAHWANLKFADLVNVKLDKVLDASAVAKCYNIQEVEEYAPDIKEQLFRDELVFLPRPDYMDTQADLTPKMRMILMDWLIEVHMKYRLRCETLHLTVNLIDRHLTRSPVARKRLQLVGVCAMFIASKFEEITPPELHDWVYITDKAYTKEEVLAMEVTMLSTLSFQIVVPTTAHFFHIFEKANGCNDVHRCLAQYILELGILDIRMLEHSPSVIVAAALLLSNYVIAGSGHRKPRDLSNESNRGAWPSVMVDASRHTEESLRECVELLRQLFDADRLGAGGQLQAVHKKFSMKDRHSVATMMF